MTVYVVQERVLRTPEGPQPQYDLTPALKYGRLEALLPPGNVGMTPGPMILQLRNKLRNFDDGDYLLALGDPVAIAAAAIIAAMHNRGRVKMLKWDRRLGDYVMTTLETVPS